MARGKHAASAARRLTEGEANSRLVELQREHAALTKEHGLVLDREARSSLEHQAQVVQMQRLIAEGSSPALKESEARCRSVSDDLDLALADNQWMRKILDTVGTRFMDLMFSRFNLTYDEALEVYMAITDGYSGTVLPDGVDRTGHAKVADEHKEALVRAIRSRQRAAQQRRLAEVRASRR